MPSKDQENIQHEIVSLVEESGNERANLIPTLQVVKDRYGEISDSSKQAIAACFDIPPVVINSILSFYPSIKTNSQVNLSDIYSGLLAFSHISSNTALKTMIGKPFGFAKGNLNNFNKSSWGLTGFTSDIATIVANGDDGEPFIHNSQVMTANYLDLLLEGMIISALAAGVAKGIIYLPDRLSFMVPQINTKLDDYHQNNLLGICIGGNRDFNFDIDVIVGMDAYTGRENSALVAFLEGKRPEPSSPNANHASYFIQNVETFIWIAYLCSKNGELPDNLDTELKTVPKIVSISGDCTKPGVYQIKPETNVAELLAMVGSQNAKAVLIGGYSGNFISSGEFEQNIDLELLSKFSSVIIFGQQANLLQTAKDILGFFASESCGQCVPCRNGIPILQKALNELIYAGKTKKSLSEIQSIAETIQLTSKCSLGQSAPNAFLSILDMITNNK